MSILKKLFPRGTSSEDEPNPLPQKPFRFGLVLSACVDLAELIDIVQQAEEWGYTEFSVSDHLHQDFAQLAPLPTLAAVAQHTRKIGLSTMVLANDFRHPAVLAEEAATLSLLSGGRFTLGLGAGWFTPDFKVTGIEFRKPAERVARVSEAIEILRGLHSGQVFSFDGAHYKVSDMLGRPPVTGGAIPLLVGGSGPVMLSLAARQADIVGLNPGLPLSTGHWQQGETPYADVTDNKIAWIQRAAADRLEALELQAQVLAGGLTAGDTSKIIEPLARAMGVTVAELKGCPHFLAGSEDQCFEALRGWRERWGISYYTFPHTLAEEMAPLVRALSGS